jgi:hypothetical protein
LTVYNFNLAEGRAELDENGNPEVKEGGPFHPTFAYELVWNLGVALLVWLVDRKWKLGKGRAFALYVMAYTIGRFWIEALRTDDAHVFWGMRVNNWVSIVVFLGALVYFLRARGPQEHVRVDNDGRLQLVTAEGEPIEWRKPREPDAPEDGAADSGEEAAAEGAEDSAPVEKK